MLAWLPEAVLCSWAQWRVGMPSLNVTYDLSHAPPSARQRSSRLVEYPRQTLSGRGCWGDCRLCGCDGSMVECNWRHFLLYYIVCGLPVGGRSKFLGEWSCSRLVLCSGSSFPIHWVYYMPTLAEWVIMDVFHKVICTPPPILHVYITMIWSCNGQKLVNHHHTRNFIERPPCLHKVSNKILNLSS